MKHKIPQLKLSVITLLTLFILFANPTTSSSPLDPSQHDHGQNKDGIIFSPAFADAEVLALQGAGEKLVCRGATPEETLFMKQTAPDLKVRPINRIRPNQTGFKIILRGTSQLESFPEAKAAFLRAAAVWESFIQTPATTIIDVDFGTRFFGMQFDSGVLGASLTPLAVTSYINVRNSLITGTSTTGEEDLYFALPSSVSVPTDIGRISTMASPLSVYRSLGLLPATANPLKEPVPKIGFNSDFPLDFDPSDGIDEDKFDFDAIAVHEIGHTLGFISQHAVLSQPLALSVWDLFRVKPGVTISGFPFEERIRFGSGEHVFFAGGEELPLSTGGPFGIRGDGRQSSHWKDDSLLNGRFIGIMDPTIPRGKREQITKNDLAALNAFGYQVTSLQPDLAPPSVTVNYPRGREILMGGDQFKIIWNSLDNIGILRQEIALSTDLGLTFPITVASDLSGNTREFLWTIPQIDSQGAIIRITAVDGANNQTSDVNDRPFRISRSIPAPDFTLALSPSQQNIEAGTSARFTIDAKSIGEFNQSISLNATVSPQNGNVAASLSSNTLTPGGSATLTLSTALGTPETIFNITVTGTAGQLVRTATASVIVTPTGDFVLTVAPNSQTVFSGSSANFTISARAIDNFNQPVNLSVNLSPSSSNVSASLSANSIAPGGNATLTVNTAMGAPESAFNIAVTGTAGQLVRSASAAINVLAPDFSLAFNPSQIAASRGRKGQFKVNINRTGGFSGNIAVSAPDVSPLKIKISQPMQTTAGSTLSFDFKIKKGATAGTQQLTFTGRDDAGRVRTAVLTLVIQ